MSNTYEELREKWHPRNAENEENRTVKILFVGLAPPTSGRYFYDDESFIRPRSLSYHLTQALGFTAKSKQARLSDFMNEGYWFTDIFDRVPEDPVESVDEELEIDRLVEEIKSNKPQMIVTVLSKRSGDYNLKRALFKLLRTYHEIDCEIVHAPCPWKETDEFNEFIGKHCTLQTAEEKLG